MQKNEGSFYALLLRGRKLLKKVGTFTKKNKHEKEISVQHAGKLVESAKEGKEFQGVFK
ncbi:MAG: hypothetical protein K0B09_06380 [Bacteroidales bacterium]|nr:hypothetical protein [Bacteroidales bacterium]